MCPQSAGAGFIVMNRSVTGPTFIELLLSGGL